MFALEKSSHSDCFGLYATDWLLRLRALGLLDEAYARVEMHLVCRMPPHASALFLCIPFFFPLTLLANLLSTLWYQTQNAHILFSFACEPRVFLFSVKDELFRDQL